VHVALFGYALIVLWGLGKGGLDLLSANLPTRARLLTSGTRNASKWLSSL
jgi:hypothetical protein